MQRAGRGSSLVAVHGLLIAVQGLLIAAASGVAESRSRECGLSSCGSQALSTGSIVADGLSCSTTCGIFPDQGSNPRLLHWQVDVLPLSQLGKPQV